ncbi:helix-turn-helix transcriptional regulator [Streptomyces sp. JV178]|uniref:helix-turn-helix domain-containing protein n=1 Tax=Streptomyces sp. JV178 TaxID=858632 RepID=UPI00211F3D88|nr:helix-turn-helix transcriptional regulator [Streptomyces sp. JV178]
MPRRKSATSHGDHRNGSARQVLAKELARLREATGKSLSDLAGETTYDRTYLHKLETGVKLGSPEVMAALDKVYGTGEHLVDLWELARLSAFRDKFKDFMDLEKQATMRYEYVEATIPGLIQTKEYAREQLRTARPKDEDELDEQITARMARQRVLHGEDAVQYRAILDEAALRRPLSDPAAWRRQLGHVLEIAVLPNVTLQVLPFSAGLQHLLGGSVTILWLPDGRSAVYTEGAYSGELVFDPADAEKLRLSYDLMRDSALKPQDSVDLIRNIMEANTTCAFPDPT